MTCDKVDVQTTDLTSDLEYSKMHILQWHHILIKGWMCVFQHDCSLASYIGNYQHKKQNAKQRVNNSRTLLSAVLLLLLVQQISNNHQKIYIQLTRGHLLRSINYLQIVSLAWSNSLCTIACVFTLYTKYETRNILNMKHVIY